MPRETCAQQRPGRLYPCKNASTDLRAGATQINCSYCSCCLCMLRSNFPLPGTKRSEPWMLPKPFLFNHDVAFRLMHGQKGSFHEQTANVASSHLVHSSLTAPKGATPRTRRCHRWTGISAGHLHLSPALHFHTSPLLPSLGTQLACFGVHSSIFHHYGPSFSRAGMHRDHAKGSLCSAPAPSWCFTYLE